MPDYIIKGCTVKDGADIARNNMTAFWQDPNWRLVWHESSLPRVIEKATARSPRNLMNDRDTLRHFKALDPSTGEFLGYTRWRLPHGHCKNEDGSPVWQEGQAPDVSPEEKEMIFKRAEAANWNPDHSADHLDAPLTKRKNEFLAGKEYICRAPYHD